MGMHHVDHHGHQHHASRNVFDQLYLKAVLVCMPARLGVAQTEGTMGRAGADAPLVDSDERESGGRERSLKVEGASLPTFFTAANDGGNERA